MSSSSPQVLERPVTRAPFAGTPGTAVFLTHSSYSSPFRVGSHQLADALGKMNWSVLHIPTPITPAHVPQALFNPIYRQRVSHLFRTFTPVSPGVTEYIPLAWLPWQLVRRNPERAPDIYARSQWGARHRIEKHGFSRPDLLFIDEPRLVAMARWFQPRCCLYRATDLYHEMMNDRSVLVAERRALEESDGFVATSQPVFDHLRSLNPGKPGLLLENGVDFDHFSKLTSAPPEYRNIPAPRIVYVGAMDERFDFSAVLDLARRKPGLSFVLIGPPPARLPGGLPANLHLLGPRPYAQIPGYLQYASCGLLPLSQHPANRGRSPMKIYEYGAAGLPVVAAHTEELARRNLSFVSLYRDAAVLPALLDGVAAQHDRLSALAVASAAQMSWRSRLDEILRFAAAAGRPPRAA